MLDEESCHEVARSSLAIQNPKSKKFKIQNFPFRSLAIQNCLRPCQLGLRRHCFELANAHTAFKIKNPKVSIIARSSEIQQRVVFPRGPAMERSAVVGRAVFVLCAVAASAVGGESGGAASVRRQGRRRGGDPLAGEHYVSVEAGNRRPRLARRRGADFVAGPGGHRVQRVYFAAGVFVHRVA